MDFENNNKTLDTEKAERIRYIRERAERLTALDPAVETKYQIIDAARSHAGVKVLLPLPLFIDHPKYARALGLMIAEADAVTFACPNSDKLLITLDVLNIWKEEKKMNIKQNVVKKWWDVKSAMNKNHAIVFKYRVEAESEEQARIAAAEKLPAGFTITVITEADGDLSPVDLTDSDKI